eukprot:SAG31_NODE_15427_length_756_cov_0.700152_1_plen_210_part_10
MSLANHSFAAVAAVAAVVASAHAHGGSNVELLSEQHDVRNGLKYFRNGRHRRRAVQITRPPPLPQHNARSLTSPPAAGSVSILDLVDAASAPSRDVSAAIDAFAATQTQSNGRTLFFPGPLEYLVAPSARNLSNWTTPVGIALHFDDGARLKAEPLAQIFIGGSVIAGGHQIFMANPHTGLSLKPNTTAGGRLTTIIATTTLPHNFAPGI